MTEENGSREEVPLMTADLVEDVMLRMPVGRDWTFEDLLQLPDIVVGARWPSVDSPGFWATDVRLVVEVMSPSSVLADRVSKPAMFAAAGVPSFWRVELDGHSTPLIVVHGL